MILTTNKKDFIVFDLDDTLYKEVDYLRSAYNHIANILLPELKKDISSEMFKWYQNNESTFDKIKSKYKCAMTIKEMVYEYRYHKPSIKLDLPTQKIINQLKDNAIKIGVITDGRGISQRNKLEALGIENLFDHILISEEFGSEKPSEKNFNFFVDKFLGYQFTYIGDNFAKDFVTPNKLGWRTIGIRDNGQNIHTQDIQIPIEYHPQTIINSFSEIQLNFDL